MTSPVFGMTFSRPETEAVPALGADFSKALIVETSDDANAVTYPLGTPVRISTSDATKMTELGTGLLRDAAAAIHAQLGGLNAGADLTIIRVAEGVDAAATAANIAAALAPESVSAIASATGATPRIIWAGRTSWQLDSETPNPIWAALEIACEKLLAVAPVDVDPDSKADAISQREAFSSERILPVGVAARAYIDDVLVTRAMGPYVVGLMIRIDNQHGGKPFNPFANRALFGLSGTSRKIPFSLLDGSTEGQQMLESEISVVVQGESGVDGAVADGGFLFIGTDNCTTGELWKQIHQVRGADYITVKIMEITRQFLGRKISADTVEAWINSIKFMLRDHKVADDILGSDVTFKKNPNSPENIRLGHLTLNLGIEPAPAFKVANHVVARFRPALDSLVNEIIARQNAASEA
jgi:hypothetical protein